MVTAFANMFAENFDLLLSVHGSAATLTVGKVAYEVCGIWQRGRLDHDDARGWDATEDDGTFYVILPAGVRAFVGESTLDVEGELYRVMGAYRQSHGVTVMTCSRTEYHNVGDVARD